jgi:hypothetical protein
LINRTQIKSRTPDLAQQLPSTSVVLCISDTII